MLGSASPELIRDTSESLAGRIIYLNIHPFDIVEVRNLKSTNELWVNGGSPRSLLSSNSTAGQEWMGSFIKTYLEKDLPLLGLKGSSVFIEKLWIMLAHLNGQILNYSLVLQYKKRLIKRPKVYFRDSGILHSYLVI